jgi:hypothetical protein
MINNLIRVSVENSMKAYFFTLDVMTSMPSEWSVDPSSDHSYMVIKC